MKSVILKNTGEIFDSIKSAKEKYGVDGANITKCCQGELFSAGRISNIPLCWRYFDVKTNQIIEPEIINKPNKRKVPTFLINTGEFFGSITEASKKYNVDKNSILKCCQGKLHSAGKGKKGEKLVWRFFDLETKTVIYV